jgi:hypothetical protein
MDELRERVASEMRRYVDAGTELHARIAEQGAVLEECLAQLDAGGSMTAELIRTGAATRRAEMTDALTRYEEARHRTRLAVTALVLSEGTGVAEVGRAFGFSRQLAGRYAAAARAWQAAGSVPAEV